MWRKCKRCDYDLRSSYLLKQEDLNEVICPNCGRKLVVTDISKVVTSSFFIMFSVIFIILPLKVNLIILFEGIWILFSYLFLPALLYDYKEKN